MDPKQRMMGLRADTTPQVARIATRGSAARPLRLSMPGNACACGEPAPDRQIAQAGIRRSAATIPPRMREIVLVGAEALASVGLVPPASTLPCRHGSVLLDVRGAGTTRAAPARALGPQGRCLGDAPRRQPADALTHLCGGRTSG
jgi:ATP phosphoribosyltransferase regulatory subunit